jgi:hypothetical protein
VEAVMERCRANPGAARRNLAVASWTNEEGARFQPSLTGSSVLAGGLSLQDSYACADGDGIAQAMLWLRSVIAAPRRSRSARCLMWNCLSSRAIAWSRRRPILLRCPALADPAAIRSGRAMSMPRLESRSAPAAGRPSASGTVTPGACAACASALIRSRPQANSDAAAWASLA